MSWLQMSYKLWTLRAALFFVSVDQEVSGIASVNFIHTPKQLPFSKIKVIGIGRNEMLQLYKN